MDFIIDNIKYTEEQFNSLPKDVLSSILDDVIHSGRNHWINVAKKDNSHLKLDYLNSIQPVDIGKYTWTVSLIGEAAHILEDGAPELDMRKTLLGDNVPIVLLGERGKHLNKEGGYYRAIPFRHAVPSSGQVAGQAMGFAYKSQLGIEGAKKLGKMIHQEAKKLKSTYTETFDNKQYVKGIDRRLYSFEGTSFKQKWGGRLKAGLAPKLKSHHKTDIYAGMIKSTKTYEKATQNQYITFRTISTNVTEGWIRKPIEARHYAEDTQKFINELIPKAIDAYIKEVNK